MKFPVRCVAILVFAAPFCPLQAADDAHPAAPKKSGMFHRILHPFEKRERSVEDVQDDQHKRVKGLQFAMTVEPEQIVLAEVRTVKVTLRLTNRGKLRQLQFPTGQRVEAVIRDKMGAVVARWSDDQSFTTEPSFLTMNPQESAEYPLTLPTRDLQAGGLYSIEGSFIGYPDLTVQKTISPTK